MHARQLEVSENKAADSHTHTRPFILILRLLFYLHVCLLACSITCMSLAAYAIIIHYTYVTHTSHIHCTCITHKLHITSRQTLVMLHHMYVPWHVLPTCLSLGMFYHMYVSGSIRYHHTLHICYTYTVKQPPSFAR